jgi:sterol 3beta-glucosyltransferase
MKITILAAGSRGDVQPYIALGEELIKSGQQVRLATFANFEDFVKTHGLEFYRISGDVAAVATRQDMGGVRNSDSPLKLVLSFKKLQQLAANLQKEFYEACVGSDAIIYHPGAAIGFFAAQQLAIPSVLALPFPMTPTRQFPSLIFYDGPRLGGAFNLLSHKIFEQVMWFASRNPVRKLWKTKFGCTPPNFASPFSQQTSPALPTVVSCSNYVFPRPDDWPSDVHSCGYWFLDDQLGWTPPPGLQTFLEKGSAPVYVGFGSIADSASALKATQLVLQALKKSGQRGILATGWNGLSKVADLPEDVFVLESAPHSWLFPRMAAVVHHGGAGTTAAGLRAGVPNIVIPFGNDQFAWGRRVYELGVGPKHIPRKNLTSANLSEAIDLALTPVILDSAALLGRKIRSENGVAEAAQVILDLVEGRGKR